MLLGLAECPLTRGDVTQHCVTPALHAGQIASGGVGDGGRRIVLHDKPEPDQPEHLIRKPEMQGLVRHVQHDVHGEVGSARMIGVPTQL